MRLHSPSDQSFQLDLSAISVTEEEILEDLLYPAADDFDGAAHERLAA